MCSTACSVVSCTFFCQAAKLSCRGSSPWGCASSALGMHHPLLSPAVRSCITQILKTLLSQGEFNALAGELARAYPDKARCWFSYDEPLSHLIYAGADVLLVPSIFEPCGLTQMIAMRCAVCLACFHIRIDASQPCYIRSPGACFACPVPFSHVRRQTCQYRDTSTTQVSAAVATV